MIQSIFSIRYPFHWLPLFLILSLGCDVSPDLPDAPRESQVTDILQVSNQCIQNSLANCAMSADDWTAAVGWAPSIAVNMVQNRNGQDTLCGSDDDWSDLSAPQWLANVDEDGQVTHAFVEYVRETGCEDMSQTAVIENVVYTPNESRWVLELVNISGPDNLTRYARISEDAAQSIATHRPYPLAFPSDGLLQLSATPFVGAHTMERLRQTARRVMPVTDHCNGGVLSFGLLDLDANESHTILQMTNNAPQAVLDSAVGPLISRWIKEAQDQVNPIPSMGALAMIQGVDEATFRALHEYAHTEWCEDHMRWCGCPVANGDTTQPTTDLMGEILSVINTKSMGPTARFRALLGENGWSRLRAFVVTQLSAHITEDISNSLPKDKTTLGDLALMLVRLQLPQTRFARPYQTIPLAEGVVSTASEAREPATDAVIDAFGRIDLEDTAVGVSFDSLIADTGEASYLKDIVRWRTGSGDDPTIQTLDHIWLMDGTVLGLPVSATISRSTGNVLAVEIDTEFF